MSLKSFLQSTYAEHLHIVLFGNPVQHSLSPLMHNTAARHHGIDIRYHPVQLQKNELPLIADFLKNDKLKGVNLTIPYKHDFLRFASNLDVVSKKIKAVNGLVKSDQGWKGYNTDVYGFKKPLEAYNAQLKGKKAIVFGSGGAAKAITFALTNLNLEEIIVVSRGPDNVDEKIKQLADHIVSYKVWSNYSSNTALYVNATPLGMKPHLDKSPVHDTEKKYLENSICYDLIYNPSTTKFLAQADRAGAQCMNGLDMLIYQGSKLFELWTDKSFPYSIVKEKLNTTFDG